jgi:hypothetical protein
MPQQEPLQIAPSPDGTYLLPAVIGAKVLLVAPQIVTQTPTQWSKHIQLSLDSGLTVVAVLSSSAAEELEKSLCGERQPSPAVPIQPYR